MRFPTRRWHIGFILAMASLPKSASRGCKCCTGFPPSAWDWVNHEPPTCAGLLTAQPATSSASGVPSLLDITLADVAAGLDSGQFTVLDLVKAYLKRIDEVDGHFRSILETNPRAEAIARSLDEEIKTSGRRG